MKKGMLPKQEYELINVCMQTIENGTPMTCSDCGRIIFNFATIKGKVDGKAYIVGLTCVKKLLNKTLYFDDLTIWRYESEICAWNNAMNARKWVDRVQKKRERDGLPAYILDYKEFRYNGETEVQCCVILSYLCNGKKTYSGHSAYIHAAYKSVFNGLKFEEIKTI